MDFLLARDSVKYARDALGVDIDDFTFKWHIYNLAMLFSMKTGGSEALKEHVIKRDEKFIEEMDAFRDTYWEVQSKLNKG